MKNLLWVLIIGIFACSSKTETIEVQSEDGKVLERYVQNIKTKEREGKSEFYTSSEQLLEIAYYKGGQLHGERKLFHENGQVQAIEQYENGMFKGIYQAFYKNGQLEQKGEYIDGMMSDEWSRYYESGELMEEVVFEKNEENGPFLEYYKNGKLKAEGAYLNGDNEQGELKLFGENGELIKKMNCEKGVCKTIWTKENI